MPASQARRLCPTAIVIPPDFTAYREKSHEVWELVRAKLDRLQSMGLDEAYADLTGVEKPLRVLRELIDDVKKQTGIQISAGVGPNRLIAKCCSDLGKPAGLRRDGPRGGLHPLRHRADAPAARHRPQDGGAPGRARLRDRGPAAGGRRGRARRALRRPHRPLPEGARVVLRRLAGRDRGRPGQVGLHRAHLRHRHRLARGARDDPAHALQGALRGPAAQVAPGPDGRDQGPPRRLDDGHPRPHAARRDQRHRARHRHRDGAAARLRAVPAGAPAGRAPGGVRRPRAGQAAGARGAGGTIGAAACGEARRAREARGRGERAGGGLAPPG